MYNASPSGHSTAPIWPSAAASPDMNALLAAQQLAHHHRAYQELQHQQQQQISQMRQQRQAFNDLNSIIGTSEMARANVMTPGSQQPNLQQMYLTNVPTQNRPRSVAQQQPAASNPTIAGMMLPPSSIPSRSSHHNRQTMLQEKKERAAIQRKLEQQRQKREEEKKDAIFSDPSLFEEPIKVHGNESSRRVSNILGDHHDASHLLGDSSSYIGVDYQPPTPAPAPAAHMIGGDEEDEDSSSTHRQVQGGHHLASLNRSTRPVTNHNFSSPSLPSSLHRPATSQLEHHRRSSNHNSVPPYSASQQVRQKQIANEPRSMTISIPMSQHMAAAGTNQGLLDQHWNGLSSCSLMSSDPKVGESSRMKSNSRSLPKLQLPHDSQVSLRPPPVTAANVHDIIREMQNPLGACFSGDSAAMPPPLSAIETPRISDHEGNNAKSVPRYFGMIPEGASNVSESGAKVNSSQSIVPQIVISDPTLSEDSDVDTSNGIARVEQALAAVHATEPASSKATKDGSGGGLKCDRRTSAKKSQPGEKSVQRHSSSETSDSDSSDSDSSSDEDNKKGKKSGKSKIPFKITPPDGDLSEHKSSRSEIISSSADHDDSNCFSLTNLLDKFKSTQSPGSQPSPKFVQASGTNRQLSPRQIGSQDDIVEGDPIDSMLSNTPQPLPDLIDHATNDQRHANASSTFTKADHKNSPMSSRGKRHSSKSLLYQDASSEDETASNNSRRSKKHSRHTSHVPDKPSPFKESPSRTPGSTCSNKPVPRQSALAFTKKDHAGGGDDGDGSEEVIDETLLDIQQSSFSGLKRKRKGGGKSRQHSKDAFKRSSKAKNVVSNEIYLSSSTSEDENDEDWEHATSKRQKRNPHGGKSDAKSRSRGKGKGKGKADVSHDLPLEDAGAVTSKKKAAMSKIFAGTFASKSSKTGQGGIKVEVHNQSSSTGKGRKVASKSSGDNGDDDDDDGCPLRRPLVLRADGARPILICRLPLISLPADSSLQLLPGHVQDSSHQRRKSGVSHNSGYVTLQKRSHRRKRRKDGDNHSCSESGSSSSRKRRRRSKKEENRVITSEEFDGDFYGFRLSSKGKVRDKGSGPSSQLMPPPEKRQDDDEAMDDEQHTLFERAQDLRAEADREQAIERKALKYLKSALLFILWGISNEHRGDKAKAFNIFKDTLDLIKSVCRGPFKNSDYGNFDSKLAVLSLRCQSLLYLKLYKLRKQELKECQKIIGDHIQKACSTSQQSSPPNVVIGSAISPTPSPAGSEGSVCSKSSGYTSAGELPMYPSLSDVNSGSGRMQGVTPPANYSSGACLSVPQSIMQKQHQLCTYLSQCHELWEMADVYANRFCKYFLTEIYGNSLTLHSSLKDLVKHTQKGLEILSKKEGSHGHS